MRRIGSVLLCAAMLFAFPLSAAAAQGRVTPEQNRWDVSKSKTATNLDANLESNVTLSLPSAEEPLVTDVVFVLDKSTSAELEQQALQMLAALKQQVETTRAKVKVGVVIFNKQAHSSGWMDLQTEFDAIDAAIKQNISSGTNTHAGLLAGKRMLDADMQVSAERKYLIFVSDGITYLYNEEPTATAWGFAVDGSEASWAGPDNWMVKYGDNNAPADWAQWLETVGAQADKQGDAYDYPYGGTPARVTPVKDSRTYNHSIDTALYRTHQVYQGAQQAGYHCYALPAQTSSGAQYAWGPSFMEYLADGRQADFADIENDILYLLDAGSVVKDVMGYVQDDYDFDLKGMDTFALTVGGQTLPAQVDGNTVRFGTADANGAYPYEVIYHPGEGTDESFELVFHVPVTNFAPVQLTYTVALRNPKTEAGTYGQYDADGSEGYQGLYTNNSATLYPVNSAGEAGAAEAFGKPTVSYTVQAAVTPTPTPDLPKTGETGGPGVGLIGLAGALAAMGMACVLCGRRTRAGR